MSGVDDLIRATVVATLRQAADWVTTDADQVLFHETANTVESSDPEGWICCPVCEEVTCDESCPLAAVRAGP